MTQLAIGTKVTYHSISCGPIKAVVHEYTQDRGLDMVLKVTSRKNGVYPFGEKIRIYPGTAYVDVR